MKLISVVGARPQFIKLAPLVRVLKLQNRSIKHKIIHSGQHYDYLMSKIFFDELEIPLVDYHLNVGSANHAIQTANILKRIEKPLIQENPDYMIVYGDTNTTLAAALAAAKLNIPIAHVESGLRSFDRSMPEEVNRVIVDQVSELLFAPSKEAKANLLREGVSERKIHFVGNVMIDSLVHLLPQAQSRWGYLKKKLELKKFILVTLHRPSNVDDPATLERITKAIITLAKEISIVFPVHPRTRKMIKRTGFNLCKVKNLCLIPPIGYCDFISLEKHAALVLTDSGGVQEETTFFKTPCLTLRPNTERPVTLISGTNRLVKIRHIVTAARSLLKSTLPGAGYKIPYLWDGHTAERIVKIIKEQS